MSSERIPAFINPASGGAESALEVLRADSRIRLQETAPSELPDAIRSALEAEPPVIVVAGGDGTISSAATVVAGTSTALCILRCGTLNHFARRMGIPADPAEALELAFTGETQRVDVGRVNERLFLNTCVIGLYVGFVRRREELDPQFGYAISSAAAAIQTLAAFRNRPFELEIDGVTQVRESALIFIGVGERDFRIPFLGEPIDGGRSGLHVAIFSPLTRPQLAAMTLRALVRGVRPWPRDGQVDTFVHDEFVLNLKDADTRLTLDGEIFEERSRLHIRREAGALALRTPPADEGGRSSNTAR